MGRRFDCVLLASHFVNEADDARRSAVLETCATHLASGGALVGEAYPESLDWEDAAGHPTRLGDVVVRVEEATRVGDLVEATVAYELGGRVWRQRFGARMLDEAACAASLVRRSRVRLMGRPRPRLVHGAARAELSRLACLAREDRDLARHAESVFSVRAMMNGDPAIAGPLTEEGVAQARRLGEALRDEPIDLCVVTEFERTKKTADIALEGRDVPRLVVPEFNDINVGRFEGGPLETYLDWARTASPLDVPEGGESRAAAAARVARGGRVLLERHEDHLLVIAHGLPIRYLLLAVAGEVLGRCSRRSTTRRRTRSRGKSCWRRSTTSAAGPRTPPGQATITRPGHAGRRDRVRS